MALVLNDRVRETTSVVGTGAVNLLGYVGGYQAFSVIGNGNTCYYTISDQVGLNWEVGIGTYSSSGNTLARTTVLKSSNSNNLVSFTAGTKDVFVTYPAETAVSGGGGGTYPTVQPTLNLDFANSKTVDPRITFVRNSTAAYYDGQTSAVAEQNLLLQSQTFATTWVASNATLGSLTTAPDGTTTAYPLTASAINGTLIQTFTATANAYTFSIYIQRVTGTGNIDITVDGTTYATQTTTGTWTRFTITTTPAAGSKTAGIRLATSGDVVNIWGAQLEQRSAVTAYTPTTTAAITNYIPVLMTAPAGVPRLDYNPTTSQALGLLIEEGRTNLATYSSDFSNAVWIKTGSTVTSAANIAPDGTLTASLFVPSSGSFTTATSRVLRSVGGGSIGVTDTVNIYVKYAGRQWVYLAAPEANSSNDDCWFDILNGVVGTVRSLALNPTITSVGNGWYRISVSSLNISTARILYLSSVDANTSAVVTGNGYSGIYIWGAQLEAGSFATSYIPTVASTVTRAADVASMSGTNFSSWYNISQGNLYVEAWSPYATGALWGISASLDDGVSNYGNIYTIRSGATIFAASNGTAISVGSAPGASPYKVSLSYKASLYASGVNGVITTNSTLTSVSTTINKLNIGTAYGSSAPLNGWVRKLSYYPVALSSSNLVALTS
jgi:hypothetical protein